MLDLEIPIWRSKKTIQKEEKVFGLDTSATLPARDGKLDIGPAKNGSMKYVSFSLHSKGYHCMYLLGALANAYLVRQFYPDWRMVVYHDDSIYNIRSDEGFYVIDQLESLGVLMVDVTTSGILSASWRFLAHDIIDCKRFIARDCDSRITAREVEAVLEWELEDKDLHIMRDHPHHGYSILGGMLGMKKNSIINMEKFIIDYQGEKFTPLQCVNKKYWWQKDQLFLRDVIYPKFGNESDSTIHVARDINLSDGFRESWSKPFPSPIGDGKYFVGEKFSGGTTLDCNYTGGRHKQYKKR